jgi:riboflavin kinase/FMN adenylyltransferase
MLITHGARTAALPPIALTPRAFTPVALRPVALTIGNFDGVHKGHQAMLGRLVGEARLRGLASCVLTFEPHPREVFAPQSAPTRLTNLREKLELLAANGIDRVHVQHFSPPFATLPADAFAEQVVGRTLGARWILIGDDFRFGAKRAGDFALLRALGQRLDFEVEAMPTVEHENRRVSSSAVRAALAAGDLAVAEGLLGRPYSISGRVVHGNKLGRQIGFPTANVQMKHNRPPLMGIFAVRAHVDGRPPMTGVASLGVRPTVRSDGQAVLEVNVFGFDGDLYRHHMRVEFLKKIRDEAKYADLESLRAQIARDCEVAQTYHRERGNG